MEKVKLSDNYLKAENILAFIIIMYLFSCSSYSTIESKGIIPINEYLLQKIDFPENWQINYEPHEIRCQSFNMDNCIEGISIGYKNGGYFDQVVFRFHNELFAHNNYINNKFYYIGNSPNGENWIDVTSTYMKRESPFEEIGIGCEKGNPEYEITSCIMRIRIEEYLMYVVYRVVDKTQTESDLQIIIAALINRLDYITKLKQG
jgi:hypothetical protein